jgi:type I restriction enzyme M protein
MHYNNMASTIWSVADLLRGSYKQSEYGKVILPFTLLRRIECILEPTRKAVLTERDRLSETAPQVQPDIFLAKAAGYKFYNTSPLTLELIKGDPSNIRPNMIAYINAFSESCREIFTRFSFEATIDRLHTAELLLPVVQRFAKEDLHPGVIRSTDMGLIFEELIRKFAEASNETAGEHYTPRDVVRLMVGLLFAPDEEGDVFTPGKVLTVYDPAAGTGGMLSVAEEYFTLEDHGPQTRLVLYGQELNDESYAICKADMLIKGQDPANIVAGNTLSHDGHATMRFNYMLSNPPYGVEWKQVEKAVRAEYEDKGMLGRFGPGLPRISDGSLLFLLHLISKMQPVGKDGEGGSRIGIVFNGSPLFTGGAGSGESEIRRFILENDLLEAIVALPNDLFYNTGIATYIWVLSNRKPLSRKGRVQLINASGERFWEKMRSSQGNKRREISPAQRSEIINLYGGMVANGVSKFCDVSSFGYTAVTVERPLRCNFAVSPERLARLDGYKPLQKPEALLGSLKSLLASLDAETTWSNREEFQTVLTKALKATKLSLTPPQKKAVLQALSERDAAADTCLDAKGRPEPDADLRDVENIPLGTDIDAYFAREVQPHVPDAWMDRSKDKIGYEIPFNRLFYVYTPPRPLEVIDAELRELSQEIVDLLGAAL